MNQPFKYAGSKKLKFILVLLLTTAAITGQAQQKQPRFHVVALYENGGHHVEYTNVARPWLEKLAADSNFSIDFIQNTDLVDSAFLSKYQLFIQLDYPPYAWKDKAVKAFEDYITKGRGGWIGFHHATLLGEFDGYPMWNWFSKFMGDIVYKKLYPHIRQSNGKRRGQEPSHYEGRTGIVYS